MAIRSATPAWPRSTAEARALQESLRGRVVAEDRLGPIRSVAGLDAAYGSGGERGVGAAAVLSFPDMAVQVEATVEGAVEFPYVPGLLSFREAPLMLGALARLPVAPDLLLVDGQGLAHPRRFGIACHIGVLSDLPTIGVAKSRLVGRFDEPGPARGSWCPLVDKGEVIGAAVITRTATRPVFVSVGHRVSLATAIDLVLRCAPRFRVPEPIRHADRRAGAAARARA